MLCLTYFVSFCDTLYFVSFRFVVFRFVFVSQFSCTRVSSHHEQSLRQHIVDLLAVTDCRVREIACGLGGPSEKNVSPH
jgi:hypothetical protein